MFAIRQVLPLEQEEPFFVVPSNAEDVEFTNISDISEEMKKG